MKVAPITADAPRPTPGLGFVLPETPILIGAGLAAVGVLLAILALTSVLGSGSSVKLYEGLPAVQGDSGYWRSVDPKVPTKSVSAPRGAKAVQATLADGRTTFTALQWTFAKPQDLYGHRWLFVTFKGTASGAGYTFFVDFTSRHRNSAGFTIVDTSNAWRAVAMDLSNPELGKPPFDLRRVISVRVTTDSKSQTGSFAVGRMTLSPTA